MIGVFLVFIFHMPICMSQILSLHEPVTFLEHLHFLSLSCDNSMTEIQDSFSFSYSSRLFEKWKVITVELPFIHTEIQYEVKHVFQISWRWSKSQYSIYLLNISAFSPCIFLVFSLVICIYSSSFLPPLVYCDLWQEKVMRLYFAFFRIKFWMEFLLFIIFAN